MQKNLLQLICSKNSISYILFDTNFQTLESNDKNIPTATDIREYLWELVGLEENILNLHKTQQKLSLPMLSKNSSFYDLDIDSFTAQENEKLFIATLQERSTTQNYINYIKEMNKKTLIYELSDEKNEHLYYQQINKRLFVLHVDLDGIITQVNNVCSHFFNLTEESMVGNHFSKFFHPQKSSNTLQSHIFVAKNSFGENVFFHADTIPITDDTNRVTHNIIIAQDVSYLKQINKELEYVSHHDTLTDLPNRDSFLKSLDEYLQTNKTFAFSLVDIDNFSTINEEYGAHGGDMLLKHLGSILSKLSDPQDRVIRIHADTFALLFEIDKTQEYIQSLLQTLQQEFMENPLLYTKEDIINFQCTIYTYYHDNKLDQAIDILNSAQKFLKKIKIDKTLTR